MRWNFQEDKNKPICLTFNLVQSLLALISSQTKSMAAMCIQAESLSANRIAAPSAKCVRLTLFLRGGSRGDLNDANYWQFSAQPADLTRSLVNCAAVAATACGVLLSARRPPPMREKQSKRHTIAKGQWQEVLHLKHYIMRPRSIEREREMQAAESFVQSRFFSPSARVYEISPFVSVGNLHFIAVCRLLLVFYFI